jgi:hypothetical protein
MIDELSDYLKSEYKIIDLRNVQWYLRMKITLLSYKNQKKQNLDQSDQSDERILLIEIKYIRDLLTRHDMKKYSLVIISMIEISWKKRSLAKNVSLSN